jgi:NAD(P)-dependent dehydrogenase (short-subunit alcohol dehydrogenase family)
MKTVIITGASGNMGKAAVKKFLKEGYLVIGTVMPNDPVPLNINNTKFKKVAVDLSSEMDSEKFVKGVIKKYKTIHVIVSTVGGFAKGSIAETKTSDLLKQYKLNFETAYNIARPAFIQMMKQNSGRIFLVGSRPGLVAKSGKGMVAYVLSKSMIFRLAELMNDEANGKDVVTAVLVPSTIDTPQNRKSMPKADFSSWVKPEAIADTIYFYCTGEASVLREPVLKLYNKS